MYPASAIQELSFFHNILYLYIYPPDSQESDDKIYHGSVVEWLKRRARDQNGLGSKPTRANLLCPWERHFMAYSPDWWS